MGCCAPRIEPARTTNLLWTVRYRAIGSCENQRKTSRGSLSDHWWMDLGNLTPVFRGFIRTSLLTLQPPGGKEPMEMQEEPNLYGPAHLDQT